MTRNQRKTRSCVRCSCTFRSCGYHLTRRSSNEKTGPIPVTTTTDDSCPIDCPFRHDRSGGCYADGGKLSIWWRKLSAGEHNLCFGCFEAQIADLPDSSVVRHDQAGDLPGHGARIDVAKLRRLAAAMAARDKKAFTYTHKPLTPANAEAIADANAAGFTVNISANTLAEVDRAMDQGFPVVVVLPRDFKGSRTTTPAGRPVYRCPATMVDGFTCQRCGTGEPLCWRQDRAAAIGFPAHGCQAGKASSVAKGGER